MSATTRKQIEVAEIVRDDRNRIIDEADEDFQLLVESVRVLGILQPLHVEKRDASYQLIDGERRWRAARAAGLKDVPCEVWPASRAQEQTLIAGLVLNEHRKAHGCIAIARRLGQIKNELGLTQEALAAKMGLPLDRIKTYGSLFHGSEGLIEFLETEDVPLKVALELVRFEKATNEARTRKLIERYRDSPLSRHQIAAMRQRAVAEKSDEAEEERATKRRMFSGRIERAFERDPKRAREELEAVLTKLGLKLAPMPVVASGPGTL